MAANPNSRLVAGYRSSQGRPDEMVLPNGELRGSWRYLAEALDSLGPEILRQRHQQASRLLRERGVTYNVYDDPQGLERSWELDPIPVVISSQEWAEVENSLQRRAELFNLILKDIYGPQDLLRRGLLPPELVHGHPGFLRPCHPYPSEFEHPLVLHAVDLARGSDGEFRVIGDRTQSPSGTGYALENRVVMSRVMPSLFRESHVHRLALFFQNLRASLAELAPNRERDEPRIVLLTPGPLNETYFEHSFLASYLGYTLVEGGDLTVRNGRVWLRSMRRLEPVDVILRRLDDDYCDALELRPDSLLGVPGLTEAVRRGNVAVVNPLGAGVLETPALNAFLPAISRHFNGKELQLEAMRSWWCGDRQSREHVLDNLDSMVIKHIHRAPGSNPTFAAELEAADRAALIDRIRARPTHYVGQEKGTFSSVPTLAGDRLEPRPAVLRAFLVGRQGGYAVMPGGLTRITGSPDGLSVSNQLGGLSKDTWILATEPTRQVSLLAAESTRHTAGETWSTLPPAAAENLFWMARYAERAEHGIRLCRTILRSFRASDNGGDGLDRAHMEILSRALTHVTATYPGFTRQPAPGEHISPLAELQSMLYNRQRTGSVAFNLQALLNAAYAVRDRLSMDTWRIINVIRAHQNRPQSGGTSSSADLNSDLNELITLLAALRGLENDSTVHSLAWSFLEIGRCLERGLLSSVFLRNTAVQSQEPALESMVLESALNHLESLNAFRRHHQGTPQVDAVIRLVLLNELNPRALNYQLGQLRLRLAELPQDNVQEQLSTEQRLVLEAHTALQLADTTALVSADAGTGVRTRLDQLLSRTTRLLSQTSQRLSQSYFTDPQGPRQLAAADSENGT
ncbi:MAG: circularly permuted type 2 ATP-grasp protein [Ectothiorhodospiraceae bacterium]|nr:circularly permuted type 2 ATP-grasp protein [Ectothiorhodospiraceae bacterium]